MILVYAIAMFVAQPETPFERLHVEWVAPEGCPGREALAAALESTVPAEHTFHASVRISEPEKVGGRWRAVVVTTVNSDQHTRSVEGTDCARVSDAAVLVLTLAATSLPAGASTGPSPNPAPPISPAVANADAGSDDSLAASSRGGTADPANPFTWRVGLQPLVGANVGLFPQPGFSAGIAVSIARGPLRAELAAVQWLQNQSAGTRGLRSGLTSLKLQGCWLLAPSDKMRLGPCAGAEAGRLSVEGTSIASPEQTGVGWASILAGVRWGFSLSNSVSLWLTGELGPNLVRPRFVLTTPEQTLTLHAVGWVVGRITVAFEFEVSGP